MTIYALDTDITSYYLKGNVKLIERINKEIKDGAIVIPPIVYYEIKKWLIKNNAKLKLSAFETLLEKYGIDVITKETLDKSLSVFIDLKLKNITIDDADILITGYCIKNNYILITNNTDHFKNINDLKIDNWV